MTNNALMETVLLLVEDHKNRAVSEDREKRKSKSEGLRVENLNVETITGKGRELLT